MTQKANARRSTPGPRRRWLVLVLAVPFLASVFGSYAWFNLDFGPRPSTLDAGHRIWLEARTNIPGYLFVPEPVSDGSEKRLSFPADGDPKG